MRKPLRILSKRLASGALALALLFVAASAGFVTWSKAALPPLAERLGEVQMRQAERREAAGALEEALALYKSALAGHFHGAANRNHCEKRAGVVLNRLGRFEEALSHLERAQTGPYRSLNGFGPLATALTALGRDAEARETAERWLSESADDAPGTADAHRALGRIALEGGALDTAEQHFQAAMARVATHASCADLARVHAARGDMEKARNTMAAYLSTAPPDEETAEHWALLEAWMP